MLKNFYADEQTRIAVQQFLLECLKEQTIELAFSGREAKHMQEAKQAIEQAWNKLEQIYGKKEKVKKANPAR